VETLKHVTEVSVDPDEEKYKVVSPETMQETLMTDSEDEGGKAALHFSVGCFVVRCVQLTCDISSHLCNTYQML
jgi:hypothetical protein